MFGIMSDGCFGKARQKPFNNHIVTSKNPEWKPKYKQCMTKLKRESLFSLYNIACIICENVDT